jgi:subtilisin-like proprotein convertase family protein
LAQPEPQNQITISHTFDAPLPDLQTVSFKLSVAENEPIEALTVSVDLRHTFIGDLIITLQPPATTGGNQVVLHNRAGGSTKNLKKTYDAATTPPLAGFAGKSCKGTWTLQIKDAEAQDFGTLVSVALGLSFPHPDRSPRAGVTKAVKRKPANRKKKLSKA